MVRADYIRILIGPIPMGLVSLLFLVASLGLSWTAQHNQTYGDWYSLLLVVNLIGIATLSVFFLVNLLRLARQYKNRVMGSRLMVRFVALFMLLTLLPIGVIYYFASQFVRSGVDSWFDTKIDQALDDAELLGISFLKASEESLLENATADASRLGVVEDDREVVVVLDEIRRERAYQDIALFSDDGQIIASSHQSPGVLIPDRPPVENLREAAGGKQLIELQPTQGSLQHRLLAPVYASGRLADRPRVLQIQNVLPHRYARLGETLQAAATEYDRMNYLRRPLKISFLISLSAITLMTTLISLWLALYAARRLVAPLSTLAKGTQAVMQGDYQTRLEVKDDDEFGQLVHSFNAMTRRVNASQKQLASTQAQTEAQRAYLQIVLEHLSSGVMSLNAAGVLQTANDVASDILSVALGDYLGKGLRELATSQPRLVPLTDAIQAAYEAASRYQESELRFEGDHEGQILSVKITRIQALGEERGYVVMFDDVTQLVHAEREAAWGEVARRLAHEIKNPLTPIQLSSERLRRKLMDAVPESEQATLDRATRTISEQVGAMKRMVDEFSNYARSAKLHREHTNVNQLIEDVVELHRHGDASPDFVLDLDTSLSALYADPDGLRQIFNNLIGNAQDALRDTPEQSEPTIHIRTQACSIRSNQRAQAAVEIHIADNGAGYDPDILERIFEPYVTTKLQGTGLGLAIVKRIVDRHHGRIRAHNPDKGGSEIRICLPLNHAPGAD